MNMEIKWIQKYIGQYNDNELFFECEPCLGEYNDTEVRLNGIYLCIIHYNEIEDFTKEIQNTIGKYTKKKS